MTEPQPTSSSRRTFLRGASLAAAAAAAAPLVSSGSASAASIPKATGPAHDGPVTAYVRDQATGEIAVMSGETEIVLHDRALAKHLATIAARAHQS